MKRYLLEVIRLAKLRLLPNEYFLHRIHDRPHASAVISMSVLPSRFAGLLPTINSLTDQTLLPEKIILNLPRHFRRDRTNYTIPNYIDEHPLVEINWIEDDLGPATKLLPSLSKYADQPDKLVIVVDDDQIYPAALVENYVKHEADLPDAAMTLSGWRVPDSFDHFNKVQEYGGIVRFYRRDNSVRVSQRVDCLQGAASFAVKPRFFDSVVFDFDNAPQEAFFVDDIWVSGNLARTKTPVYVIPAPFRFGRFVSLRQSSRFGLSSTANADNTNNNKLYRYFEKQWWSLNA